MNPVSPLEEALAEILEAEDRGQAIDRFAVLAQYPEWEEELAEYFDNREAVDQLAGRSPLIGQILGAYRVEELIGRGGMGSVYRATHLQLGRPVALKILPAQWVEDREFVARFLREARTLASLDHPNIVAIHDLGTEDRTYFLAMEYIEGLNLRQLAASGKLPPEEALQIIPPLCEALEYAHQKGVVHRDIKPENILIDSSGRPKIADFGLAKIASPFTTAEPLTRTNVRMGTADYMAPEQRRNPSVDHRADIFALGVVLYELLTGQLPVGRFDPPSKECGLGPKIDAVVHKALESDPDRRFQSASELGTRIQEVRQPSTAPMPQTEAKDPIQIQVLGEGKITIRRSVGRRTRFTVDEETKVLEPGEESHQVLIADFDEDEGECECSVPRDAVVHLDAPHAAIECSGLIGKLILESGSGNVEIKEHIGGLSIVRSDEGAVSIEGLVTEEFEAKTADGAIEIKGFRLATGVAQLESVHGEISCLFIPRVCSFRYSAQSAFGPIKIPLPTFPGEESSETRGHIGSGEGQLEMMTHSGKISLDIDPSVKDADTPTFVVAISIAVSLSVALDLHIGIGIAIFFAIAFVLGSALTGTIQILERKAERLRIEKRSIDTSDRLC